MSRGEHSGDRTAHALLDFLAFARTGDRLVARGRAAYDGDEMLRLAAEAILYRVGEAVARVDDTFLETHPQVRWRPMKGMRNLVAHEYDAVDHGLVWNALEQDLPREAAEVQRIVDGLADMDSPPGSDVATFRQRTAEVGLMIDVTDVADAQETLDDDGPGAR